MRGARRGGRASRGRGARRARGRAARAVVTPAHRGPRRRARRLRRTARRAADGPRPGPGRTVERAAVPPVTAPRSAGPARRVLLERPLAHGPFRRRTAPGAGDVAGEPGPPRRRTAGRAG
ncbi:hypothetical protein SGPA1_20435 [Streptomyces misionensis JCM 4497]